MTQERLISPTFEIEVLSQDEFAALAPSPERFRDLVYSVYTADGYPRPVTPHVLSRLSEAYHKSKKDTVYIAATGEVGRYFQTNTYTKLINVEAELRNYENLAGFLKVEWGTNTPEKNLPIEAMILTKNFPWPVDAVLGYAASFTTNPLLPREMRVDIQTAFHKVMYSLAEKEGFSDQIFTILAPHVLPFVEESGLSVSRTSEAFEPSDDAYATSVFETFPGYWRTVPGPDIYRFIPDTKL